MTAEGFMDWASLAALALFGIAMLLALVRLIRGPGLPDRVLALDLLTVLALGFVAALVVRTGAFYLLDIALALALLGFLSTLALVRYLLVRATSEVQS